jgi:hypothetical protein
VWANAGFHPIVFSKKKGKNIMSELKTYKVLSNLRHNGAKYLPGDDVDLDEKTAEVLLDAKAVGVLSPLGKNAGGTSTPPAPPAQVIPERYKEYVSKTNKEQIEYLQALSQEDFEKFFEEYLKYSKAEAKKAIQKKLKENTGK